MKTHGEILDNCTKPKTVMSNEYGIFYRADICMDAMDEVDRDAKLLAAEVIILFTGWRDCYFAKSGITFIEEPPAIQHARAILQKC